MHHAHTRIPTYKEILLNLEQQLNVRTDLNFQCQTTQKH